MKREIEETDELQRGLVKASSQVQEDVRPRGHLHIQLIWAEASGD